MSDLIDRQAAIDAICKEGTILERNGTVAMCEIKQWCVDLLERLPSAQPEIIMCRDCKHWGSKGLCDVWDQYISNDEFYCGCADAERRTDE